MAAEFYAKYVQPVPGYFTLTFTKDAALDLIQTLDAAVRDLDGLPESIEGLVEDIKEQYRGAGFELPNEGVPAP